MLENRQWVTEAIGLLEAEAHRSADTPLHRFMLPREWGIDLYLKDESVHPTGSLKHRLARSLLLYGLVGGRIGPDTTLVEASSGSTAVSEAYFAQMLGLEFVAVMPASTSPDKIALIEAAGARCHLVDDPLRLYDEAEQVAAETSGYYLDQFLNAERATDWRGNNNIAESIFHQLGRERFPVPAAVVVGAGTGGTSATIGRYVRYRGHDTEVIVADSENSVFFPAWTARDRDMRLDAASKIEGIGRPRMEPSFLFEVVDEVLPVADADSVAAMRLLAETTSHHAGASTGTNLVGAFTVISRMRAAGRTGSVVTLICDQGRRYPTTYYDDDWVAAQGWDLTGARGRLEQFLATGRWDGA